MNLFFSSPGVVVSLDVTLKWDIDQSVRGYKIYYKSGSSGPPYDGKGAYEGDSPIDVGYVSECDVRYLSDDETYYFVATAYNDDGESGYSNEVSVGGNPPQSSNDAGRGDYPSKASTNNTSSGTSGGGGGCFISALLSESFFDATL